MMIKKWLKARLSNTNPLRLLYHKGVSNWIAAKNNYPAKDLICIGITGTDGKTSTTHMLAAILEKAHGDIACLSTQKIQIGKSTQRNTTHMTTLGRQKLQTLLTQIKKEGITYVVIECSSQAIAQSRLAGIPFHVSAITNISNEHLDYHGTFKKYLKEKQKLFRNTQGTHVIHASLPHMENFIQMPSKEKILIGKDLKLSNIKSKSSGSTFTLEYKGTSTEITLSIPGKFNTENAALAAGCAIALNIPLQTIKEGLQSLDTIPGRSEEVKTGQSFRVILDFAVTPNALKTIYTDLKQTTKGKLIGVFGCTGNRDKSKRAPMGKIAASTADTVILTTDEPYHEKTEDIARDVQEGMKEVNPSSYTLIKELDRLKAIQKAFEMAQPEDTVVITGMGDFDTRVIGKETTIDWDERKIIINELKHYS